MPEKNIHPEAGAPVSEEAMEKSLLERKTDMFGIYQLKLGDETRDYRFEPLEQLAVRGLSVDRANYALVYAAPLRAGNTVSTIFETFNVRHPVDFQGHSLSVSDVVVLQKQGDATAYYVDDFSFVPIPDFYKKMNETEGSL